MELGGTKQFHEGTRAFDFFGGLFELFKHREAFDVYVCTRCGRVELGRGGGMDTNLPLKMYRMSITGPIIIIIASYIRESVLPFFKRGRKLIVETITL